MPYTAPFTRTSVGTIVDQYLRRIQHVYKHHYIHDVDNDYDNKQWTRNPDLRVLGIPAFCRAWNAFEDGLNLLEQSSIPDTDAMQAAYADIEGGYFEYARGLPQPTRRLLQRVGESLPPRKIWDNYLSSYQRQRFVQQYRNELEAVSTSTGLQPWVPSEHC